MKLDFTAILIIVNFIAGAVFGYVLKSLKNKEGGNNGN